MNPAPTHPYLSLFSHAPLVADLLRGYLREAWVDRLDLASLEPWSEEGVAEPPSPPPPHGPIGDPVHAGPEVPAGSGQRRRRDASLDARVWRLRWQGGRSWIYLLLAFPTQVDPRFALRLLQRAGRLHLDLEARRELPRSGRLPAVVTVALYRGEELWTAPRNLLDLAEPAPHGLDHHAATFRYRLLDAAREPIPAAGGDDNLVSALFRLERARTLEAVAAEAARLACRLTGAENGPLRLAFTALLNDPHLPRHFPGLEIAGLSGLGCLTSLACPEAWSRQQVEHRRGLVRLLARLLEGRFGPLARQERERIDQGEAEQLLAWAERAVTARSLEEVFAEAGPCAG